METAVAITSINPKPSVHPLETMVTFPCRGTDDDCIKLTINNPSQHRLTFKLTGTKLGNFIVAPDPYGFIAPKDNVVLELLPKPMQNANGWNKYDNFKVYIAGAPKGNLWVAEDIWEKGGGPKDSRWYEVKLKAVRDTPLPPTPKKVATPKEPTPKSKKATPSSNVKAAVAGEPYMEPMLITVKLPVQGTDDETMTLTLNNTSGERLTWRIKGTKMQLFDVEPKCGFAEPHSREEIEVKPKRSIGPNSLVFEDNFMVITANAPPGNIWTPEQLWEGTAGFQLVQRDSLKVKIKAVHRR